MYFDTVIKTSVHLLVPWFFNNSFCFSFLLHCIFQILSQVNCCCCCCSCGINLFLSFHSQKYPCGCMYMSMFYLFVWHKQKFNMLNAATFLVCVLFCWLLVVVAAVVSCCSYMVLNKQLLKLAREHLVRVLKVVAIIFIYFVTRSLRNEFIQWFK